MPEPCFSTLHDMDLDAGPLMEYRWQETSGVTLNGAMFRRTFFQRRN
jgi:hypothetical protein